MVYGVLTQYFHIRNAGGRWTSKRTTADHNTTHQPRTDCACRHCVSDRQRGCASVARNLTGRLEPKFDPYTRPIKDGLTLTQRRKEKNQRAVIKEGDEILSDPSLTARHNIHEFFRIFTDPTKISEEPAWRLQNPRQGGLPDPPLRTQTVRARVE